MKDKECPECGARRGITHYPNGSYCFACGVMLNRKTTRDFDEKPMNAQLGMIPQEEIKYVSIESRLLRQEYCKKYRYGVAEYKGEKVQVAQWFDATGAAVAQKIRFADKRFKILGDASQMGLYGLTLARDNGKRIVITEGELDAIAAAQALGTWPVVSIPNGAKTARKAIEKDLEFLEKYETVVFCFDQDAPGQAALKDCLDVLTPGKVKIARLPLKDAGEMVQSGRSEELVRCLWEAKDYRPAGIVSGDDLLEAILNAPNNRGYPYPWPGFDDFLRGIRQKELILMTGGTGSGKSTVARILACHCLREGKTVGYLALEESVAQSALGVYGAGLKKNLRLTEDLPEDEVRQIHGELGHRFHVLDHFGSIDGGSLTSKMRYFIKALKCEIVFLDHISIAISGQETDDERRMIDRLMTELRSLVEETQVTLVVVSHLRRVQGTPAEEGGQISLQHLRGSQTLSQIPDIVLAFERNQQAEDEDTKNTVLCRVLKNRPVGLTGVMTYLKYQPNESTMYEVAKEATVFNDDDHDTDF